VGCTQELDGLSLIKLLILKEFELKYPELNNFSTVSSLEGEVWVDIFGYEGYYQVSNFGRVKSLERKIERWCDNRMNLITKKSVIKKIHCDSKGYPTVQLTKDKLVTFRVHRLVAEHFLPKPSDDLVEACKRHGKVFVNHKDGDKLNATVGNLEWCNQTYNCYHAVTEQTRLKLAGENCYHVKLTEKVVLEIVAEYNNGGVTQQTLADKYGVKQITISNILTGYSWSTVTGIPKKQRKFKHRQQPMKD
jgi:hypothetical protein